MNLPKPTCRSTTLHSLPLMPVLRYCSQFSQTADCRGKKWYAPFLLQRDKSFYFHEKPDIDHCKTNVDDNSNNSSVFGKLELSLVVVLQSVCKNCEHEVSCIVMLYCQSMQY